MNGNQTSLYIVIMEGENKKLGMQCAGFSKPPLLARLETGGCNMFHENDGSFFGIILYY